jgi:hypothetical protein
VTLSQRSVGLVAQAAGEFGHGRLSAELLKAGLADGDPGQLDRQGKSISRDKRASAAAKLAWDRKNLDGLLILADRVLNSFASVDELPAWATELMESLRNDGYEAVPDEVVTEGTAPWIRARTDRTWRIMPLGDEDVPLTGAASSLAMDLRSRGLLTAAEHFDQAIESFADGRWEAANGQLRAAFEDVLVKTARRLYGWSGNSGGQALDVLHGKGALDENEHLYIKGLWGMSHTNGAHPGMSNQVESQLRIYAILSAIRFVLTALD